MSFFCRIFAASNFYSYVYNKQEGINHSWKWIHNIMSSQSTITTRMKLENKDSLVLRNVTRPNQEQVKIYSALKFKQTNPKMKKKAVVPHK